jgi:hypothetical protein
MEKYLMQDVQWDWAFVHRGKKTNKGKEGNWSFTTQCYVAKKNNTSMAQTYYQAWYLNENACLGNLYKLFD